MTLFLLGCLIILAGGLTALLLRNNTSSARVAITANWLGCGLAAVPVIGAIFGRTVAPIEIGWSLPGGQLSFALDALSAFFCLPLLIVVPLAAMYGGTYLKAQEKPVHTHWFYFNLLVTSMLAVFSAANGLLFLIAWEIMAVSSFFLVMFDSDKEQVRKAGWIYLVATHIGTALLLAFFALLNSEAGSLQFAAIKANQRLIINTAPLFIMALIGFGVKAGFFPLHVWLPEAHPAAPSHVSALMSGVMIKTGIYGILRAMILIGRPEVYMGWSLVLIGIVSGVTGVLFALAQHDLKRLLAYHSVENIGIITLGLGAGILGLAWKQPALVFLGLGGGLLHVFNHALFKSLLFLGAGSVSHGTGTLNLEQLGGLAKRMQITAVTFLIGAAAISGLPPLNGFISEFYIYFAGINGAHATNPGPVILAACILVSLALIGGLAVACFTKAAGIVFLGEARTEAAAKAHESGRYMLMPMIFLAALCLMIGLAAPLTIQLIKQPIASVSGMDLTAFSGIMTQTVNVFSLIVLFFTLLFLLAGILILTRYLLPRHKQTKVVGTWDCGFGKPTPRMQYTASSYAQPLTELFSSILGIRKKSKRVEGYFPVPADFHTETPDVSSEKLFNPVFRFIDTKLAPLRRMQHGNLSGYLLYIAAVLVLLLIWKAVF